MKQVGYISIMNNNFGDALNEPILKALSSNQIDFVHYNKITSESPRISAIGSIAFLWTGNTVVWGSGVLADNCGCASNLPNMEFKCVRGPKTRKYLLDKGYTNIPKIYCDPGVLALYFYKNILSVEKKYTYGIFPHNTENPLWHTKNNKYKNTIYLNYTDQIDRMLRNISQCETIISSSLHGIIIAEALGIPVIWYRLTDENDSFKFYDYFEGTNRYNITCNDIRGYHPSSVDLTKLVPITQKPKFDIRGLLNSYPFEIDNTLKNNILKFYETNN